MCYPFIHHLYLNNIEAVQTNKLYISFSVFVNKGVELYMKKNLIVSLYN